MLITMVRQGNYPPVYKIEGLDEEDYLRIIRGLYEINTDKHTDKLLQTLNGMRRYS